MARQKRISVPEALHHGMGRGVNIYVILCLNSYYLSWYEISFLNRFGRGVSKFLEIWIIKY